MECNEYQDQFTDLLTGNLEENKKLELETHLSNCPACQMELKAFQQTWDLMMEIPVPEPSTALKPVFNRMLRDYENANETRSPLQDSTGYFSPRWNWPKKWTLAYGIGLLVLGLALGYFLHTPKQNEVIASQNQLDSLSSQVREIKQTLVLSLLENPSASERMRAVSYTEEIDRADPGITAALLTTLNNDPNVNVRLVALGALVKFSKDPSVRSGLVESIIQQQSPLLQSAIADVMVRLQEKRSIQPLQKLLNQKDLDKMVKEKIEASLHKL